MSAKWRRVQQWDKEHLTGAMTPVRLVLHALSSIWLAVILLTLVSLYAVFASVPIGMLAQIPSYAVYALALLAVLGLIAGLPALALRKALSKLGAVARFALPVVLFVGLSFAAWGVWTRLVWPALHYDPANQTGLRFFADFALQYEAITLRRLPGLEMTELEFYSWWPLRIVLILFCLNMLIATVRRIEFTFKNLGVLTVHTGIITIALGSIFYQRFKQEGDTILLAAQPGQAAGEPGPPQSSFYDHIDVVLYTAQLMGPTGQRRFEQRPIPGLPRYNDYNLGANLDPEMPTLRGLLGRDTAPPESFGPLDIPIDDGGEIYVDPKINLRVIGYSDYADRHEDFARARPAPGVEPSPLRIVDLHARDVPGLDFDEGEPAFRFALLPRIPAQRVRTNAVIGVEYTAGMDEARWSSLGAELPPGLRQALIVELLSDSGDVERRVALPATVGAPSTIAGYTLTVRELHPEPPFPIITEGYANATSSVAVVDIETPEGERFGRWIYHRFPELNQDIAGTAADGRPNRASSDESRLRVWYADASVLNVYFDEREGGGVRAIVRSPEGVRTIEVVGDAGVADVVPGIDLVIAERWEHAEPVQRVVPTPEPDQDRELVGGHDRAFVAVEVTHDDFPGFRRVVWVGFNKYMGVVPGDTQDVALPDGTSLSIAFGRQQRQFPSFRVSMVDFEMIAYDHRGAPRDYQSIVRVEPRIGPLGGGVRFEPFDHRVKLNSPLRAPFHWSEDETVLLNTLRRLSAGLNPTQFKLSQAGWDQQGWNETQALADQGLLERPAAQFTILHVGNNPGIHVIALGGILMSVGIPWAFYVKPWLVRRERDRIKQQLAAQSSSQTEPKPKRAPDLAEAQA
ncbi:MAG: hypothetical protein AAF995_10065 [Planctomycetota bacterium]